MSELSVWQKARMKVVAWLLRGTRHHVHADYYEQVFHVPKGVTAVHITSTAVGGTGLPVATAHGEPIDSAILVRDRRA